MNDDTRTRLRAQRQSLAALDPGSWTALEHWRAGARPLFVQCLPQFLTSFDEHATRPEVPLTPRFSGPKGDNFAHAATAEAQLMYKLTEAAQQRLLRFIDSLLDLPTPVASGHDIVTTSEGAPRAGNIYAMTISNSRFVTVAQGGSTATVTATTATETLSQEQHRNAVARAQHALVQDQDALNALDSRMYEALNQFLRLAREIQVEQTKLADIQKAMKDTLDDVWAEQVTKGMQKKQIPAALDIARALTSNPVMAEVVKSLVAP